MEFFFWTSLSLIVVGFVWAVVRLVLSVRGMAWKHASFRLVLGFGGSGIALLVCLIALFGTAYFWNASTTLPTVFSPSQAHRAYVSSFNGGATEPYRTEVETDIGAVYRSEASPEMVRLRWDGDSHLVVSTPIWSEQVGKPIGFDDPDYYCSPGDDRLKVTCDTYLMSSSPTK